MQLIAAVYKETAELLCLSLAWTCRPAAYGLGDSVWEGHSIFVAYQRLCRLSLAKAARKKGEASGFHNVVARGVANLVARWLEKCRVFFPINCSVPTIK